MSVTAEIISIGTELLLGQILNTNSKFLSAELASLGINCYRHTTVGDNKDRIKNSLKEALQTSQIVITTGGLGPTADDLTTECIAELFQTEQVVDQSIVEKLEATFRALKQPMAKSNLKQALRPLGSKLLPNPTGTAPGIIWELDNTLLEKAGITNSDRKRIILTFPGVPSEMEIMWQQTAKKTLESTFASGSIFSVELKHFGIGESALAEKYAHLLELENPTVAPLAGHGECRLRVTARATSTEEAHNLVMPVAQKIREESGLLCYGIDTDTLESVVGDLLSRRDLTIAIAESCTGGLVSKRLTDISGSSKYIHLNTITYANEAKHKFLGVPESILNVHGAVSAQCAVAMASGIKNLARVDIGLSVTGVAGPGGGTAEKPVGLVYLGITARDFEFVKELHLPSQMSRQEIRYRAANHALNLVRLYLLDPTSLQ